MRVSTFQAVSPWRTAMMRVACIGTLNVWRKREGERIQKGDVLLEVETDKADMEFEAYMSGTLEKILVQAGATAEVP